MKLRDLLIVAAVTVPGHYANAETTDKPTAETSIADKALKVMQVTNAKQYPSFVEFSGFPLSEPNARFVLRCDPKQQYEELTLLSPHDGYLRLQTDATRTVLSFNDSRGIAYRDVDQIFAQAIEPNTTISVKNCKFSGTTDTISQCTPATAFAADAALVATRNTIVTKCDLAMKHVSLEEQSGPKYEAERSKFWKQWESKLNTLGVR